jgi:fermentation-respiration switch protein FrsA (DUF1100 family)
MEGPRKTRAIAIVTRLWSDKGAGWRLVRITLLLLAGLIILVVVFENKLIYFPARHPEGNWAVAESLKHQRGAGVVVEDVWFAAADGVKLHGWYCSPLVKPGSGDPAMKSRKVLLWFHGNAGNISHRYEMMTEMVKLPIDVFIIDYRGYGRSEGTPSESGLYKDADAAWSYLTDNRGLAPGSIVLFGKSLGGAVAVDLATRVSPSGLIVQSSFTSIADMADTVVPVLVRPFLSTRMASITKVGQIGCPKLFIHSRNDDVIPYKLGRRLFDAASEPKRFHEVRGARHNDTYIIGGKQYFDALREFLTDLNDASTQ